MVTNITNFSRSGLFDWMAQRVSAVILATYFLFLIGFFIFHPELTFEQWHSFIANKWMRTYSLLTLLCLSIHAWVGMWTVTTDYLTHITLGKWATSVRFLVQALCGVLMFVIFVWGLQILWGF